jgi:hypothetical protein
MSVRARSGVAVAVLSLLMMSVAVSAKSPSPSASGQGPLATGSAGSAILWETPSARLEASALSIHEGDKVFTGVVPTVALHSDPGDDTYRTLEVEWTEQGLEQRLFVYFAADEHDWWVTEVRTRDGYPDADWITYPGPLFRTPRGGTFEGDVHLTGGMGRAPGELIIDGLRLTAFAPGTGPAPLTGCHPATAAEERTVSGPQAAGGVLSMEPTEAEALLRSMGVCFTFRYEYPVGSQDPSGNTSSGYSERWCTAPPSGTVTDVATLEDGELVIFVEETQARDERPQPPEGWGCEAA